MAIILDIIGDVHGELPALRALGRRLGYDVDGGWTHPANRFLIFLGDLVDRGAYSLEVAELVCGLVERRRALCIMGNHEYNLVAYHLKVPGYEDPKESNKPTIRAMAAEPERWEPVLRFLKVLPIGINLPDLRLIHACWNKRSLEQTAGLLGVPPASGAAEAADTPAWIAQHVSLRSPFEGDGLLRGIPGDTLNEDADAPHEILMKGFEVPAPEPFTDNEGVLRTRIRAIWWKSDRHLVLTDKPQVFGHYWNVPPVDGHFAPPYPSGHPELRAWGAEMARRCPPAGGVPLVGDVACVDFHGVTKASKERACIGALRWPEREIVWASGEKTAGNSILK
jgi:hypothetical protein